MKKLKRRDLKWFISGSTESGTPSAVVPLSNGTGIQIAAVQEHQVNITNSTISFMATALMKFSSRDKSNAYLCRIFSRQMQC